MQCMSCDARAVLADVRQAARVKEGAVMHGREPECNRRLVEASVAVRPGVDVDLVERDDLHLLGVGFGVGFGVGVGVTGSGSGSESGSGWGFRSGLGLW